MPKMNSSMGAMLPTSNTNIRKARSAYLNGSTHPRPKIGNGKGNIPRLGRGGA